MLVCTLIGIKSQYASGEGWRIEKIDHGVDIGQRNERSLVIDLTGKVHSVYDGTYAVKSADTWQYEEYAPDILNTNDLLLPLVTMNNHMSSSGMSRRDQSNKSMADSPSGTSLIRSTNPVIMHLSRWV